MRIIIALLALLAGSAQPAFAQAASSQPWAASRRAVLHKPIAVAEPDIVSSLGSADTRTLTEINAESRRRQAEFDARLAHRGSAALASVCVGCGTKAKPKTGSVVRPLSSWTTAPDAESIYSTSKGFDPAQARLD